MPSGVRVPEVSRCADERVLRVVTVPAVFSILYAISAHVRELSISAAIVVVCVVPGSLSHSPFRYLPMKYELAVVLFCPGMLNEIVAAGENERESGAIA